MGNIPSAHAQVDVPANLRVSGPVDYPGGGLRGEYWKRPPNSIFVDGDSNPEHRIDVQIAGFGPADGIFKATRFGYSGNDLDLVRTWLGDDGASFVGNTNNLDDAAFRLRGFINVLTAGTIKLGLQSDDGSRITIGGVDIVAFDGFHGLSSQDFDVNFLEAGLYPIEFTYFNHDWTFDGDNHSGNPDPSVHGPAQFFLSVNGALVTLNPETAAMFHETGPTLPPTDLSFFPAPGLFTNSVIVAVSKNTTKAVIQLTLNGTNPTSSSPLYSGPIVLTNATEIRAALFSNNVAVSQVFTAAYARVYAINDGIPAMWREQYFGPGYLTDPQVSANADPDGDLSTNREEYLAGTNPLDPTSGFKATVTGVPKLLFGTVAGRSYRILRRDHVQASPVAVATVVATNSLTTYLDTSITTPAGIYMIELLP
jgi:hypothetical protein